MSAAKKHKKYQKDQPEIIDNSGSTEETPSKLGLSGFLGVVLVAGALFNVPQIMKRPETNADWMMLAIIGAMLIAGLLLLLLPGKLKKH